MNVSTSASVASSSEVSSSAKSTSSAKSSEKTSEKSFEEEMNSVTTTEEKNEKTEVKEETKSEKTSKEQTSKNETKTENQNQQKELNDIISQDMISGAVNFTDFKYHNESQSVLTQNIQNLLNTKDLMATVNSASTIDYDAINMSDSDANFFANLVQNTDMSMKDIAAQIMETNNAQTAKSVQVSSVLMEKLAESLKTNQPFRIDFDKDVSVIIKVNKDGSLMANFIPGDKAVEQYLKNNIASLRQRFDDENLSYSELSYSNSREQQQQRRSKKENNNE